MGLFRRIFGGNPPEGASSVVSALSAGHAATSDIPERQTEFFEIPSRHHYGEYARSRNGQFLLTWADDPTRGRYFLLSGNRIFAEGRMSRPNDGKVADNGTFILNQMGLRQRAEGNLSSL